MNFYENKKVFIAGGAGLCGQALIRKLVPLGAKVTATEYHRRIDAAYRNDIDIHANFDLREPWHHYSRLQQPITIGHNIYSDHDIVFWCAAKVGGAKAIRETSSELIHYNLEMTARNIKAAVDAGVGRFVFISSSYVYPEWAFPCSEDMINHGDVPAIHYGLGWIKRYFETLCKHHHTTSKTRFAIIRPTAMYGPYDDFNLETCHALPALLRKVVEKQFPLEVWGDGSEVRQWTYIDDIADALLDVAENYAVAEPLNICTTETRSIKELVDELLNLEGCVYGISGFNKGRPDIHWLKDQPTVISKRLSDPSKAKRLLGIECKTSLRDGLKKTIEWYKTTIS